MSEAARAGGAAGAGGAAHAGGAAGAGGAARAGAAARETVLFDLDGVLTRRDTFGGFVARRIVRAPLRTALALPLVPLMLLQPTRRRAVTLVVQLALARLSPARYRAEAQAYGAALAVRPRAIQPDCVAAIHRHRADGARVVVVTASEESLARALLDALGVGDVELVASRLRRRGRRWQVALHNHGEEKPRQLAARGIAPPWDVAYSDHEVDFPMLRGARVAVLVNPGDALAARARRELAAEVRTVRWAA